MDPTPPPYPAPDRPVFKGFKPKKHIDPAAAAAAAAAASARADTLIESLGPDSRIDPSQLDDLNSSAHVSPDVKQKRRQRHALYMFGDRSKIENRIDDGGGGSMLSSYSPSSSPRHSSPGQSIKTSGALGGIRMVQMDKQLVDGKYKINVIPPDEDFLSPSATSSSSSSFGSHYSPYSSSWTPSAPVSSASGHIPPIYSPRQQKILQQSQQQNRGHGVATGVSNTAKSTPRPVAPQLPSLPSGIANTGVGIAKTARVGM
jgi:hypothetical protein